jgi:hypothetical protein
MTEILLKYGGCTPSFVPGNGVSGRGMNCGTWTRCPHLLFFVAGNPGVSHYIAGDRQCRRETLESASHRAHGTRAGHWTMVRHYHRCMIIKPKYIPKGPMPCAS